MREFDTEYTVVGHAPSSASDRPAIVLLNRTSRLLRQEFIADLIQNGYTEIVSVERKEHAYSVESLSTAYPGIRFVLTDQRVDVGTRINIAFSIVRSDEALVLWSSMGVPMGVERALEMLRSRNTICVVPLLRNERNEPLPSVSIPVLHRRNLKIVRAPLRGKTLDTLYPSDHVGLYNRARYASFEGYDGAIDDPYWQLLDFGFRAYLWGYSIPATPTFRIDYETAPPPVDETVKPGYARFYAKNLAGRMTASGIAVAQRRALPFAYRSRFGILRALRVFSEAKRWIDEHQDRFTCDAKTVVERWSAYDD
jgi:hypothetical protein